MSAANIQISEASHQLLLALAEQTGQTTTEVLDKALEAYRRKAFFEQLNAGYADLRSDKEAWAEHLAERKLWDATLMDGLETVQAGRPRAGLARPCPGKGYSTGSGGGARPADQADRGRHAAHLRPRWNP
jgi:predicted transcriptional regulator